MSAYSMTAGKDRHLTIGGIMKTLPALLMNILVIGAFGILLAYAIVGMIQPPAGNLYFGIPASCPQPINEGVLS